MNLKERAKELYDEIRGDSPYKKGTRDHREWIETCIRMALAGVQEETRMTCAFNVRSLCDAQITFLERRHGDEENVFERQRINDYKLASDHAFDACQMSEEEVSKLAAEAKEHGV